MNTPVAVTARWVIADTYRNASEGYKTRHPREVLVMSTSPDEPGEIATVTSLPHAPLLAAAPELREALSALVGLVDLVALRPDVPADLPSVLRSHHRYQEAIALLKRIEGK